jgi:hypothetical protein
LHQFRHKRGIIAPESGGDGFRNHLMFFKYLRLNIFFDLAREYPNQEAGDNTPGNHANQGDIADIGKHSKDDVAGFFRKRKRLFFVNLLVDFLTGWHGLAKTPVDKAGGNGYMPRFNETDAENGARREEGASP